MTTCPECQRLQARINQLDRDRAPQAERIAPARELLAHQQAAHLWHMAWAGEGQAR